MTAYLTVMSSGMAWTIKYLDSLKKQVKKIDPQSRRDIRSYLEQRVAQLDNPRALGQPLSANLTGLWRYRVADYRIICDIQDQEMIVLVVRIGHRKQVYGGH